MKNRIIPALALCLALSPLQAQTTEVPTDTQEGFNLMEEGAKLLLRGLMAEMEPNVEEFRDLMQEFGPAIEMMLTDLGPRLQLLLSLADDLENYGDPEILPNGDIIMRRNPDAPPYVAPETDDGTDDDTDGEIEL